MFAERLCHDIVLHVSSFSPTRAEDWIQSAVVRARQHFCAIRGHDLLLRFGRRRLWLRCDHCGWESPGWTVDTFRHR